MHCRRGILVPLPPFPVLGGGRKNWIKNISALDAGGAGGAASRWTRRIRGWFILVYLICRVTGAANTIRAPRRRRRSLRLNEIINATLDKLIFISDILANYEMQLFSRPVLTSRHVGVGTTTTTTTTTTTAAATATTR